MTKKGKLPKYIAVKHLPRLANIEDLPTEGEQLIELASLLTGYDRKVVSKWKPARVAKVVNKGKKLLEGVEPKMYHQFEFKGVTYGFSSLQNMVLGEWVDIEHLLKDPSKNLAKIVATLYRPVTSGVVKRGVWDVKNLFSVVFSGKQVPPHKMYKIEDYDYTTVEERANIFEELPASVANGVLGFFLVYVAVCTSSLQTYSVSPTRKQIRPTVEGMMEVLFQNTTGGL